MQVPPPISIWLVQIGQGVSVPPPLIFLPSEGAAQTGPEGSSSGLSQASADGEEAGLTELV